MPLYHSVTSTSSGTSVLVTVGEGGTLPNGRVSASSRIGFRHAYVKPCSNPGR
jgi:hypothetical protein